MMQWDIPIYGAFIWNTQWQRINTLCRSATNVRLSKTRVAFDAQHDISKGTRMVLNDRQNRPTWLAVYRKEWMFCLGCREQGNALWLGVTGTDPMRSFLIVLPFFVQSHTHGLLFTENHIFYGAPGLPVCACNLYGGYSLVGDIQALVCNIVAI